MSTCRPPLSGPLTERSLPTFVDPGGKGLRLTASGLPEGLTFSDLGGGKGAIEGVPEQATSASIRIVATNHHDRTAQMSAALVVGDKPAPPPAPVAKLETPAPAPSQKPSLAPVSPQPAAPPASAVAACPRACAVSTDSSGRNACHSRPKRRARRPSPARRPRSRRSPAWKRRRRKRPPLRPARILLPLSRPSRRRKRPRRSSRALTGASASSSSRFLEQPNRTSTRRSAGRSNPSAASIQPTSARSASRRT